MIRVVPRKFVVLSLVAAASALAQNAVSARAGMVNYVEGIVELDGKEVQPKFGEFPEMKKEQTLAAKEGRAELLLTPGVFLRVAENSSIKMVNNDIEDAQLDLVSGVTMTEAIELRKFNAVTYRVNGATIAITKAGLYRIDADDARLRVYEGEAKVTFGSNMVTAHKGKEVQLGEMLVATNFDVKSTDAFYRWGSRRSEAIARANPSAARDASYCNPRRSSYTSSYATTTTTGLDCTGWVYNPWLGLITYIPMNGIGCSFYGYCYYSPAMAYVPYSPMYRQPALGGGPGVAQNNNGSLASPARSSDVSGSSNNGGLGSGGLGGGGLGGGGGAGGGAAPAPRAGGGGGRGR